MDSKVIINEKYLKFDDLPESIRTQILNYSLMVFPRSSEIHPGKCERCYVFSTEENKDTKADLIKSCPYFEYEDDYNDDDHLMCCYHNWATGGYSYCNEFVDPELVRKEDISIAE